MIPPLDIFKIDADGRLVWRGAVATLDIARLRIEILKASERADYVVFSQQTGHKTIIKADDSVSEIV